MSHTKIEMDVMRAQLRTMTRLLELQEKQADALGRIAESIEEIQTFLHGTTIKQVEEKRVAMKNKNRKKPNKSKVKDLKEFVEKAGK